MIPMAIPASRNGRTVRDVMQTDVLSVVPEMTVRELIHTLLEHEISGAPVIDPKGKIAGVVSTTDVMRLAAHEAEIPAGQLTWQPVIAVEEVEEGTAAREADVEAAFTAPDAGALTEAAFDEYQVRDIMTPVAFTVDPTDSLETAVMLLLQGRIHRALVVENGTMLGIVTPFDVLQAIDWQ